MATCGCDKTRPAFGHQFAPADLARILSLSEADFDARYPIQEVSTGLPFVIAPLVSLDAVQRARVNLDRLRALLGAHDAIAPAIFCAETLDAENDIHVRVLDDIYGAPEDPATGSANGCIAAYIVEHGYFGGDTASLRSEQGYQIGRPSLLRLEALEADGDFDIRVGGRVELVAQGPPGRRRLIANADYSEKGLFYELPHSGPHRRQSFFALLRHDVLR